MRALVVDDDFTSQLILQELLKPYGQVNVAGDGQEAITSFRQAWQDQEPYDLICLDIMMPGKNGQAVLKEIRALEEGLGVSVFDGVKIIMTSSLGDGRNIMQAFQRCEAYLVKPIDGQKLLNQLKSFGLIE